jgi:hypothetical protein
MAAANAAPQIIRAYLSHQHFEDVENSCPMVALPGDVARSEENVKQAFETVFKAMVDVLERGFTNGAKNKHSTAQAVAALCVGGMVIARSLENRALADELRNATMTTALQLGGWDKKGKPGSKKTKKQTARR